MSSAAVVIVDRAQRSNTEEPTDFDSLIWQPCIALLSRFSCLDNERPNLRSRRLVVAFPAKLNLLGLTINFQTKDSDFWLIL